MYGTRLGTCARSMWARDAVVWSEKSDQTTSFESRSNISDECGDKCGKVAQ